VVGQRKGVSCSYLILSNCPLLFLVLYLGFDLVIVNPAGCVAVSVWIVNERVRSKKRKEGVR